MCMILHESRDIIWMAGSDGIVAISYDNVYSTFYSFDLSKIRRGNKF